MTEALKNNIRKYTEYKKISVNTLEKIANLKPTAIHNILLGRSKNPSIDVLSKIANTMGCTIDHLISEHPLAYPVNSKKEWNGKLYQDAMNAVYDVLKEKNITTSTYIATQCILNTYEYALQKNHPVDTNFIKWIIAKLTNNDNNEEVQKSVKINA